jgi:hypothetical protein
VLLLALAAAMPVKAQRAAKGKTTVSAREDTGLARLPGMDTAATRKYVAGLTFVSDSIVSTVTCHGGRVNRIAIWPEVRSHVLNPEHVQKRGRIVARIRNIGPAECDDVGLRRRGEEAYWWMGPDRGDPFMTEFWQINPNGTAALLAGGSTRFNRDGQWRRPAAYIGPQREHKPPGREMELKLFGHNSTWIACLGGCCESLSVAPM